MPKALHAVALVLVLAAQAAPGGCSADKTLTKDCDVTYRGLRVEQGAVRDVVTPVCTEEPEQHILHAWIEYRRIGDYSPLGYRQAVSRARPDATGFPVPVSSGTCVEGWYRTTVHVEGIGPVSAANPHGVPFDFTDHGAETYVTAADCQGGS